MDLPLLVLTYVLAMLGVLIIFSATYGSPGGFHKKQLIWIAIGTCGLIAASLLDYHWYPRFARSLYLFNLGMLALVNLPHFHNKINGAARWISLGPFQYQPSEFAKVIIILTLAAYLCKHYDTIKSPITLFLSFLLVLVPALMIIKQPDLGTGLALLAIWFGMVFVAGAKIRHLLALAGTGLILCSAMWFSGVGIKKFQRERLLNFVGVSNNAKSTGYHVTQARIAIGSGGLFGKGLLNSTQVRGGFIPERQTDFIFTDIGEEFGFVGCVVVVCLYGWLIYRGVRIIASSDEDIAGKLIATGVVSMIAFHVIENIGMNIGVMPVAGVPLLLISYGGSSMIVTLFCIGLLESVSLHRHELSF